MKNSKWLGIIAGIVVIITCYMTWIYVPAVKLEIGGMSSSGPQNFGKPGLMNIIFTCCSFLMFLLPFIWAKRLNMFFCAFSVAWAARNYFLLSKCYGGDCPERRLAIYIYLIAAVVMLIMSLLPDIKLPAKKEKI